MSCNKQESIKVSFTGDVILDRGVKDELRLHGDSLLINSFRFIKHDNIFINLEGTLTDTGNVQNDKYNFKADISKAAILQESGVTHVSIANNHIYDYGKLGYEKTIEALKENDLKPLGNKEEPIIIKRGVYKYAVLSASLTVHNDSLVISSINKLKASVIEFRENSKNIPLIIYIHWGLELQPTPEKWQINLAESLIDLGVDAIIGHHPHVTQTIDFINNKPVFYSIGNYIADAYLPNTSISYAVEIEIKDKIENVYVVPVQLKRYFPKTLSLKQQIIDLKKHLKYSNICLVHNNNKWKVKPIDSVNFSEKADIWIYSDRNTISSIKKINSKSYLLSFEKDGITSNVINLFGELSEFHINDINNDNNIDVLVGISKKVQFDSIPKKRINIYTLQNTELKPLWLGTRFINDVESFKIINHNNLNYLSTKEIINDVHKVKRIYEWDDFGFALTTLN